MKETKVVNKFNESFDVYIGRPSKWGNPFVIGRDGSRHEVIDKYHEWLIGMIESPDKRNPPSLEDAKKELQGKVLGCFCKPKECHGDVLAFILNENS